MKSTNIQFGGDTAHIPKYAKVLDGRKQPIRGIWERNGCFMRS